MPATVLQSHMMSKAPKYTVNIYIQTKEVSTIFGSQSFDPVTVCFTINSNQGRFNNIWIAIIGNGQGLFYNPLRSRKV